MKVDLTSEELQHIEGWYVSASGESATGRGDVMFALLEKLGIPATDHDLYYPDPMHSIESYRPVVIAEVEAIKAYRKRHPELEVVQMAEEEQPMPPEAVK